MIKFGIQQNKIIYGIFIFCFVYTAVAEALECRYVAKVSAGNGQPEMTTQGICGEFLGPDEFRISPAHLKKALFKAGLTEVLVDDKAFYVAKTGKAVRVHVFENGADYFIEGLARTIAGGKFGYINKKLAVIIKPAYDFAFPFQDNRAIVCMGCSPVGEGEHQAIRGGAWGIIDRTGTVVIPIRYGRGELEEIRNQNHKKQDQR